MRNFNDIDPKEGISKRPGMKVNDGYEASGSMSSEDEEESSYEDVEVEVEDESGDNSLGVGGVDQSESQGLM